MNWTFGQKIAAGFAVTLVLTLLIGMIAAFTLRSVVTEKDRLVSEYADTMIDLQRLNTLAAEGMANNRGFLLAGQAEYLERARESREAFETTWRRVAPRAAGADASRVEDVQSAYWAGAGDLLRQRQGGASIETLVQRFDAVLAPKARALKEELTAFVDRERQEMEQARRASTEAANQAIWVVGSAVSFAILLGVAVAVFLTRTLTRQIGSAIHHLQSSSTELQAAANQQATGSGEQASAMSEVSTTMKELLTTSRQIAVSAQRVAAIAQETTAAARSGDAAVGRAQDAVGSIRRQVDQIVVHMLDLGRKSQQVGGILSIIQELAEQTNILAINATIEAAGAGENGRRFGAVAEEIRKLADRVGGSTGEIRTLIEEMRASANTTVMVTEDGSKAVDEGTRQFTELAAAFQEIAGQVVTTAEAAREIELSTQQQATAVEQVNLAIYDAAQAAKQSEASSRQTLETSVQLADVSNGLARLVEARARA